MVKRASLQVTQSQSYCKYHSIDFTCKKSSYKTDSHVLPMSYPVLWQPEVTPSLLDGTPLCDRLTLPPAPCPLPPVPCPHPLYSTQRCKITISLLILYFCVERCAVTVKLRIQHSELGQYSLNAQLFILKPAQICHNQPSDLCSNEHYT